MYTAHSYKLRFCIGWLKRSKAGSGVVGASAALDASYNCSLVEYIVLGLKLDNYMIFNGIHLFSRNEDFGKLIKNPIFC